MSGLDRDALVHRMDVPIRTDRGELRTISDAEGASHAAACSHVVKLSGKKDPVWPNLWKVNRHRRGKPPDAVNLSGL